MRHDALLSTLRQSAAVKLLQSPHAPLTLSFLYDQFKQKQHITIPHARLAQLEKEKAEIQAEIDAIKATGQLEHYSETQIKERFFEANDVARRLLARRAALPNWRRRSNNWPCNWPPTLRMTTRSSG